MSDPRSSRPVLISRREASDIIARAARSSRFNASLDLGRTTSPIELANGSIRLGPAHTLTLAEVERIARDPSGVFRIDEGRAERVAIFCSRTQKHYRLRATRSWPALEISGVLMHRIKETDPREDARRKIGLIRRTSGPVLDSCCGLGYTAITAARLGWPVTTIEVDENVLELARINPYSRELFDGSLTIELVHDDVGRLVVDLPDRSFSAVIHDPPIVALAGELYSGSFYGEVRRILRPGGILYHYVGKEATRPGGRGLRGIVDRLRRAGFREARVVPEAHGILAS